MNALLGRFGAALAAYLSRPVHVHSSAPAVSNERLLACLQPGDVLLVEGNSRISSAIKYLTQSTWSHAALFVGFDALRLAGRDATHCFVEADTVEGVRSVGIEEFSGLHTRICRPVGLREPDRQRLICHVIQRLGHRYDLRNVFDLARYLLPNPPVPLRWRRKLIHLGSGDPTRAICSTLIAQAFQSIRYPILPIVEQRSAERPDCPACVEEILQVRHHSLFAPRDFDVSPYFAVVKPTLENGFDYTRLHWQHPTTDDQATPVRDQPFS
ncbi:YiiX/YebB-like N1pC/P60 family cysteine hydrolase [Escherichia coli]|uniref:YiiX/YebB-like N1pC/P60 family cysteine hydrolase n=1 Tax=Escherichia coli TaxID=562 RepID=UPI0010CBDDB1|nr:YiiX/YebB-like N1pC/P60 family cysteine hydrolase [Escherichia coli]GCY10702.1 hypothetical protein HmCmsJML102_00369 [Escherichia coli]